MMRFYLPMLGFLALAVCLANSLDAADTLDADTMIVALRTNEIEDQGFIEYSLEKVADGTLPAEMVHSTFLWAKKKPRYKFQYYKKGLLYRAQSAGIPFVWPPTP